MCVGLKIGALHPVKFPCQTRPFPLDFWDPYGSTHFETDPLVARGYSRPRGDVRPRQETGRRPRGQGGYPRRAKDSDSEVMLDVKKNPRIT